MDVRKDAGFDGRKKTLAHLGFISHYRPSRPQEAKAEMFNITMRGC
jgi:hypothetical protein